MLLNREQYRIRRLRLAQSGEQGGSGVGGVRIVGLQGTCAFEADQGLFRLASPVQGGPLLHECIDVAGWMHGVDRATDTRRVFSIATGYAR